MDEKLTIGEVARRSGVPVPRIRFYEAEGLLPAPDRTPAGYRLYTTNDIRRLRLIRRARLLGMTLPEARTLVQHAFASECGAYAREVAELLATQRARIDRRIRELRALRSELEAIEGDVQRVAAQAQPGLTVAECGRCPLVDEESGEQGYCNCVPAPAGTPPQAPSAESVSEEISPELLQTLACEIGRRPRGAPTFSALEGAVRRVRREADTLVVEFDGDVAEALAAFVDAERRCCSSIGWELEIGAAVRLRISATPLQLAGLEEMFSAGLAASS